MTPKFVVYECENCGRLFYREVANVVTDDGADCHVHVILYPERDTNEVEEFPMCLCLGGTPKPIIDIHKYEVERAREEHDAE